MKGQHSSKTLSDATVRTTALRGLWAGIGAFLLTLLPAVLARPTPLEVEAFRLLNGLPDLLYLAVWPVMQLGQMLAVPAAAALGLLLRRRRLAFDAFLTGAAAYAIPQIVKDVVGRGRPDELLSDVVVRGAAQEGLGYVSGHATLAVALAVVATPHLGTRGRVLVWSLAAVVGLARVYVGAHFPLDVLGGAALGVAIPAACRPVTDRLMSTSNAGYKRP